MTHAVLRDRLQDLNPGEVVYIRYEGKRRSASGFEYADYTIQREDDPTAPRGPAF